MKSFHIILLLLAFFNAPVQSFETPAKQLSLFKGLSQNKESVQVGCSMLGNAFAGADAFFRSSPYTAVAIVCGMKGMAADFCAQKHQLKKRREEDMEIKMNPDGSLVTKVVQKFDLRRTAAFLIYGAFYQGIALEYSYNHIYPRLFGNGADIVSVLKKVSFDMCFQSPLFTMPVAYISKAFVFGYSFREAIRRYVDDIMNHGLMVKYYLLWVPVMFFAFGVVPDHLRVTFCAGVSFFWMILLSTIANKNPSKIEDDECALVDGATCNVDG